MHADEAMVLRVSVVSQKTACCCIIHCAQWRLCSRASKTTAVGDPTPRPPLKRKKFATIAARQIKKYQSSAKLLLAKLPFMRLVREVSSNMTAPGRNQIRTTAPSRFAVGLT
ncbi:hypothetical protein IWX90DRAFT_446000 [Phyllosticta citrichinensis]|uniref:Histone H2A/H2B/H3 domain-containing protein n=1 Tax=Phyllosticta citrichinensis TaxID=1130410 RepID=A0ABR1XFE9_9PEZI